MEKLLNNKVIVVTGGNGLLGKEIVKGIIRNGGICINMDINNESTDDLFLMKCDITDSNSIDLSLSLIIKKYNKIDGLVNNAYPRTSDWGNKFEDVKFDSWKKNVDFQLNSYFYVSQQVSKFMMKQKSGSIINLASVYGSVGPDFNVYENTEMTMPVAYSAIKGGVINLTRYLASYLGKYNINVNTVSPGGIFDNQNPIFVENYNNKVPMKRMGTPKDISPSVIFLLSEGAKYISGQNVIIDGGWTAI